jgi:ring-1,2-phenylacetyl-CoA epoxidase subunit PaaC
VGGVPVSGGRRGVHTEAMGPLLTEMQELVRSHPGARW